MCACVLGLIAVALSQSWNCPADACARGSSLSRLQAVQKCAGREAMRTAESPQKRTWWAKQIFEDKETNVQAVNLTGSSKTPRYKSVSPVLLSPRIQKANRRRSRAGYAVCSLFHRDGSQSDRPLPGFRRYRALRWWTSSGDPVKKTSRPGRQQVHRALRRWALFTLWRGGLCCNTGGSWQGYTLQMLCRDIFWSLPSASRRARARPTQRESPAMRPRCLRPVPGLIWRCPPLPRATEPREFTPMDGTGSTAVQGSGVAAVIIPPRGFRELETHLAASWRLVDWNT